ncbi:MAG TPA: hypothetical protein VMH39_06840, partial [Gemmatimonadaceae bacterium]|nr:hypothetical protein [Gemmatimonadaceae bacterium]
VGVLDSADALHEVTTFRRDVRTDGRHAVVEFGASLDDDLARRDFTINAIAYSASRDELRDPFDGRGDLARRVVRAVGDPEQRMREDRLRALRGIRFAARFDFEIESATLAAISNSAPYLGRLSPERVKQELDKTMEQVRCPGAALRRWRDTGALATLIPALATLPDEALLLPNYLAQPSLTGRPQRRINRVAGLVASLDGTAVERVLTALRYSRRDAQWAAAVVGRWRAARPTLERLVGGLVPVTDRDVRILVSTIGRLYVGAVIRIAEATWSVRRAAGNLAPSPTVVRALHRRMLRSAFRDPLELSDLAVDGDDLRRAGIPAGPMLGKILNDLLQGVLEEPERNRVDTLLADALRRHAVAKR